MSAHEWTAGDRVWVSFPRTKPKILRAVVAESFGVICKIHITDNAGNQAAANYACMAKDLKRRVGDAVYKEV